MEELRKSSICSEKSFARRRAFVGKVEDLCEKYGISVEEMDDLFRSTSDFVVSLTSDYYRAGQQNPLRMRK